MPEYLAPGVFVEEVSFRSKSIEGVGTSVAAIVGPTRTGPMRGVPEVVTSFNEFTRIYGDLQNLTLGETSVLNHTAIAAKAFFDGGGKQLFVSRIARGVNDAAGSTASSAQARDSNGHITFDARFPGEMGNYTLEVQWRDSENLINKQVTAAPEENEIVFLHATGLTSAIRATGIATRVPADSFPLSIDALIRRSGNQYVIVNNLCVITRDSDGDTSLTGTDLRPNETEEGTEGVLIAAGLVSSDDTTITFTRVTANQPTGGELADGTHAVLEFSAQTNLENFHTGAHWGEFTTLRGTLNEAGTTITLDADLNPGVASDLTLHLAALAAAPSTTRTMVLQRNFDITLRSGGPDGEPIYTYGNISTAPDATNSLSNVMPASPEKRYDHLSSPVSCTLGNSVTGDNIMEALYEFFAENNAYLNPTELSVDGPRYLITMEGGDDGEVPVAIDYEGETDEVNGSTGFKALEDIEDISIVMTPAAAADETNHQAVVAEMQKHCMKMRYRVGIVDARESMAISEIRTFRSNFDDSRLALYYPWVVIADPRGITDTINAPPAGFIAGVYANTDVQRGVHKPPANEPVIGALRFAQEINRFQQELLNPNGINCLRSFTGRGHRVWGGRTLSSDPEWKYVNVRRYFLYLERSIEKSTQWVVFEPNGEILWANVRNTVEGFLYNEWYNGRLLGSAKTAYFVRCDRSTMTQNDLDNGRLVCEIGVAPLKPAEFVIFRIGQKTADS